jgi:hypothetical protein
VNPHAITRIGGALVVGTAGDGALGLARSDVHLPSTDVTAVTELGGSVWVGTRAGLLHFSGSKSGH